MKIFKITTLYKLLYVSLIATFFYFFFTERDVFNYKIGELSITETSTVSYPLIPKQIKSLNIKYKGITVNISGDSPVLLKSDDGIYRKSKVENIIMNTNSIDIYLENQININIKVDNRGERLTVSSSIPKVFPTIKELIIPYALNPAYSFEIGELSYILRSEDDEFHLKLNDNYTVDQEKDYMILFAEDDKLTNLTFSPLTDSNLPLAEKWYLKFKNEASRFDPKTLDDYLKKITTSINNKFNTIRFNADNNSWSNLPSVTDFTEESVIVYLSEALKNGNYSSSLTKIEGLKNRYSYLFGFQSTPFLGNVVINGNAGLSESSKDLISIQSAIKLGSSKLIDTTIPEHFITDNSINLIQLEDLMSKVDLKNLSLKQMYNYLNNILYITEYGSPREETVNNIKKITDKILNSIAWDETGIYLVNETNESLQSLNLDFGQILIKAAQHESSEYTKPIGEALIMTYIMNSDSEGKVHRTYNTDTKVFSNDYIKPELSYLKLSDNKYIPHYFQDNGVKIWTISDSIQVNKTSKSLRISISYPIDYNSPRNSHFLVISGIAPYTQLYFKGRPWRADRNFEKWGVGYYYNQISQRLYFMPNHSKEREEIIINF